MPEPRDTSSDEEAIAQAKREARARARLARDGVHVIERRAAAHELSLILLSLTELAAARTVLAYAALPNELDPAPAIWRLRRRGVRIAYPRIEAPGVLGMHFVDHEVELVPGPFGLAQPSEHAPHVPTGSSTRSSCLRSPTTSRAPGWVTAAATTTASCR